MREINTVLMPAVEERLAKTKAGQEAQALAMELAQLDKAAKDYVMAHYKAGDGFDHERWLATKVQGHRKVWDIEFLRTKLSRGKFKQIINEVVDRSKVDELVRSGGVSADDVEAALKEVPNEPYVKITYRGDGEAMANEAENVAAALGL